MEGNYLVVIREIMIWKQKTSESVVCFSSFKDLLWKHVDGRLWNFADVAAAYGMKPKNLCYKIRSNEGRTIS